jgi:hypothetical protein
MSDTRAQGATVAKKFVENFNWHIFTEPAQVGKNSLFTAFDIHIKQVVCILVKTSRTRLPEDPISENVYGKCLATIAQTMRNNPYFAARPGRVDQISINLKNPNNPKLSHMRNIYAPLND